MLLASFSLAFAALFNLAAPHAAPKGDTTASAHTTTTLATSNVVATAAELTEFNHLLNAANLKHQLRRPTETYTVFAPTNEAVRRVPVSIRQRMFVAGNPGLRKLLRAHMVAGNVDLTQLPDGAVVQTLSGEALRVAKKADGSILLNGVYRVTAGRATANGRVYTIESMIAPVN